MGWVEIMPKYGPLFRDQRWDDAQSFLDWTGVLVNLHRHRRVEQVAFAPLSPRGRGAGGEGGAFYLKKESGVSLRDRFRNAWAGFGWCATMVREAAILQAAQRAGVGCPEVVALGEVGKHAFVLTRDESEMTELRTFLTGLLLNRDQRLLADALGRELARLHDAGFDHPDLFAKHILVSDDYRICILDWQRARWQRSVSWRLRVRDLATLDATLHDVLASDRLRLRCLRAYMHATTQADSPPFARLAREIRHAAARLREQRNLREIGQLPIDERDQQFVQAGDWFVVRSFAEEIGDGLPALLQTYRGIGFRSCPFTIAPTGSESYPTNAIAVQAFRCKSSERDLPNLAHTLFRLQRFGIRAPRLLAIGWTATHTVVWTRMPNTIPFEEALAKASRAERAQLLQQAGNLVRQVHEAGYSLPIGDNWNHRLGACVRGANTRGAYATPLANGVVITRAEPLERRSTPWQEFAPAELNRQRIRLSRSEQLRFLQGYLRQDRNNRRSRQRQAV